jgi:hypothetical protein
MTFLKARCDWARREDRVREMTTKMRLSRIAPWIAASLVSVALLVAYACSDEPAGSDADADSDADGAWDASGDGPIEQRDGGVVVEDDGGTWTCYVTICDGHELECGDCVDNDNDGRTDSSDPECLGPCDNTEGPQLTADVGGEGGTSCNRDCYFDFGNGSGNDECRWDTLCDPNAPDSNCPFDAGELGGNRCLTTQPETCLEVCRPLTPNGCDCFGCCYFDALAGRAAADGGEYVWLGSGIGDGPDGEGTCTFALLTDTTACRPCEPVEDCWNDCGPCELCLGRDTLPPECFPDDPDAGPGDGGTPDGGVPPGERCPDGLQPCGLPDDAHCPEWYYCITGCCQETIY